MADGPYPGMEKPSGRMFDDRPYLPEVESDPPDARKAMFRGGTFGII